MLRHFSAKGMTTAIAIGWAALTAPAFAEIVHQHSPHSVAVTMDRLEAAVTGAGATVFARIDHAAGATSIDAELRPTELLIFGNPKLGTPAMQAAQTAGLDLPLRVLAYEDADGVVHVVYHTPATLVQDHGLPADAPYIAMMTGALSKLTGAAIAPE
jgi:uncharacterized protein (DUF302 family)